MTQAAVFPGQGSQFIGMGLDLAESYPNIIDMFAVAEEISGQPLMEIVSKGPKELLDQTIVCQPAIFTVNYIYWSILKSAGLRFDYVAGHSLGELSACLAAGVFSFEDGLRIVKKRAELMSQAAIETPGGMMAVLGLDDAEVAQIAESLGLQPANYNSPGQVVIAGPAARLNTAPDAFKNAGARKVVRLAVSGAFHSRAMSEAAKSFEEWLQAVDFKEPRIPVIGNAAAKPYLSAEEIKYGLAAQIVSPVRWRECVEYLSQSGASTFIEVGPGRVISGLIKRILPEAIVEQAAQRFAN